MHMFLKLFLSMFQTFEVEIKEENLPELDELFEITLISAASDDGLVGSTNVSGASIDPLRQTSQVTIEANDYPFGLLQFADKVGVLPSATDMIDPAIQVPSVRYTSNSI